jgi:putative lipase involved disintegration of autophagic bodies
MNSRSADLGGPHGVTSNCIALGYVRTSVCITGTSIAVDGGWTGR